MQNPHTKWRIELAQRLVDRVAAFKGIRAIAIAGSVARNYADEYADIEIPLFWEALPDDATRHAIAAALNASFLYAYSGPAWEDQLLVGGIQVDMAAPSRSLTWQCCTQHRKQSSLRIEPVHFAH